MLPRSPRRMLRIVGWNAFLLVVGMALIALAAEAYLRLTVPFMSSSLPREFVPEVGFVRKPGAELRLTNRLDFWTVPRANSLGFLDREPPNAERAAASCHITVIGDSFVEAMEVPIDDKFHVQLEALAAEALPHLDVTTSAFGIRATGQVQQLPFYDEYARRLRPKLLVLVFAHNDFIENSPFLWALKRGWDPEHLPVFSVERRPDGKMVLRPPDPDHAKFRLLRSAGAGFPERIIRTKNAIRTSWSADWLDAKKDVLFPSERDPILLGWVEVLSRRPGHAAFLEGWQPTTRSGLPGMFARKDLPPVFEDALDYTAFALEQFRERADRDGMRLVILASYGMKSYGIRPFDRMSAMAARSGIPVIDQADYILRRGGRIEDAHWRHDDHWNATGHRWAAEALLEYLKRNREICRGPAE